MRGSEACEIRYLEPMALPKGTVLVRFECGKGLKAGRCLFGFLLHAK